MELHLYQNNLFISPAEVVQRVKPICNDDRSKRSECQQRTKCSLHLGLRDSIRGSRRYLNNPKEKIGFEVILGYPEV